jgi:hypothetical protein
MQGMYSTLRGLVQPLEQPNNPRQGVLRTMKPVQLRDAQFNWRDLEKQWAAHLLYHSRVFALRRVAPQFRTLFIDRSHEL